MNTAVRVGYLHYRKEKVYIYELQQNQFSILYLAVVFLRAKNKIGVSPDRIICILMTFSQFLAIDFSNLNLSHSSCKLSNSSIFVYYDFQGPFSSVSILLHEIFDW